MARTDLAAEGAALKRAEQGREVPGVEMETREEDGVRITEVAIISSSAAEELGKPCGRYVTLEPQGMLQRRSRAFPAAARILARELREMLPPEGPILVAGLGNRAITPDAIGPQALESVLVTRHLMHTPEAEGLRCVSACALGVLGTTGVESAEYLASLCRSVQPAAVIAVDALAAAGFERLCTSVQLADTGIVPGSGVGNHRAALNESSLGVPVIAVGVPTVVDAGDFAPAAAGMFVTPRDIDTRVVEMARLIGFGVDLALHPSLQVEDLDLLLG